MKHYQIKSIKDQRTIFTGTYKTFKDCVEDAVEKGIELNNADLGHQNLQNLNIDTAQLSNAIFDGSNLNDANLSEGCFMNASFKNTSMIGTCMAESNFTYCDFSGAHFGANIVTDSCFDDTRFDTLSCFSIPFQDMKSANNAYFKGIFDNISYDLSRPPIVITGLFNAPIIVVNDKVMIGHQDVTNKTKLAVEAFLDLAPANAKTLLHNLTNQH